ncbi:MAG: hypothetical protein OEW19_00900 [Acidobacteriota bacterium]|nr:hypothetical protein [Acidobacteriota bacterium]
MADSPQPLEAPDAILPAATPDLALLYRAYYGSDGPPPDAPTTVRDAQLTISRHFPDDVQDRQIYVFVDEEPWGKVRYGESLTREIPTGPHRIRAFNTLFSRTLDVDVRPAEHVRLCCGNGFPKAGWLLMLVLHVTYLRVRLEREPAV